MAIKKSMGKRPSSARPSCGKGRLSFYFSFLGSISKELYTGAQFVLGALLIVIGVAFNLSGVKEGPVLWVMSAAQLLLLISVASLGYKRAHSLGISGFYSLAGMTLFTPFFMLFKPAADRSDDGSFAPKFATFRKIGAFFTKNARRFALYLLLSWVLSTGAAIIGDTAHEFNDVAKFMSCLFALRLIQLPFVSLGFAKKYYAYAVKTLSFVAFNAFVIFFTIAATYVHILMQLHLMAVDSIVGAGS
ncbi:MAG: hypothetical protein LBI17_03140 [Rickettsiales bacterium]|jgi:hypothetical protein|nr:hypothetical protein [Rickettsiales bacterium]